MTRRQKLVRTALLVPLLLAAAGVVFAFARDDHAAAPHGIVPPPPEVSVARVISKEVSPWDEFTGRVSAVETVELRPRVSGYIERVAYEEGAEIRKGDLLFVIDQRPFITAVNEANAALEVAKSTQEYAETQFKRAESLANNGSQSVSTLDDRRRDWVSAQANVRGAQATADRAALDLEYTKITAPISGRIDRRLISAGNLVQADQSVLTTIVSLDPIDFYFDVDERLYFSYARDAKERGGSMQEGDSGLEVVVRVADRAEAVFKGKLDFAENRIDNATGTMRVRATFPNADGVLQPGMFGRINVPGSLPHSGVLVPDEAIGADQDRRIVFLVDEAGMVSAKPVRTGPLLDGYRVIRGGLTGDETIIVNGLMHARPGTKVKVEMVTLPPKAETAGLQQ